MYCLSLQRNSFGFLHLLSIRLRLYPVACGNSLNHNFDYHFEQHLMGFN